MQTRAHKRAQDRGKKRRLASLGHTLEWVFISHTVRRCDWAALPGEFPPKRLCPAARASLRAMLALLLQTLASITKPNGGSAVWRMVFGLAFAQERPA